MKTIYKPFLFLTLVILGLSCSKDDGAAVLPDPLQELPGVTPKLVSIAPLQGPKETLVTIKGENFGTEINRVQVFINEKEATVQSLNERQITAIVPAKAFSGKIKVLVGESALLGPKFTYEVTDVQVTTFAGSIKGFANGSGENAQFTYPRDIVMDHDGNLFVADRSNNRIRKITPSGVVSTFAGGVFGGDDGTAENAKFRGPAGIAIDKDDHLYISDTSSNKIRKITPNAEVTTLAGSIQGDSDGIGENARLHGPLGIVINGEGVIYINDTQNSKLRGISLSGEVSTFAGEISGDIDGTGKNASFKRPSGMAIDVDGNLYSCDTGNHKIRKITPSGVVSTLAGSSIGAVDGPNEISKFKHPEGVTIDVDGIVYIADTKNNRIRKITPDGMVSTIAGSDIGETDGPGTDAKFNFPTSLIVDSERTIYVVDSFNHRIRKITQE